VPTTGMSGVEKGKSRNFTSFALEETNSEWEKERENKKEVRER
jgi:hypothetical protein